MDIEEEGSDIDVAVYSDNMVVIWSQSCMGICWIQCCMYFLTCKGWSWVSDTLINVAILDYCLHCGKSGVQFGEAGTSDGWHYIGVCCIVCQVEITYA